MAASGFALRGLYAITSENLVRDPRRLLAAVAAALEGGAALIQYRDKINDAPTRRRLADSLQALCAQAGRPLIVNDDPVLAEAAGAAGVHLGRQDGALAEARARLGEQAVIGLSCNADLRCARTAAGQGASYVAVGRFFASRTKPDAPPAHLDDLRAIRAAVAVPVCAIGGITPQRAAPLIAAGADLIAAIEGVFGEFRTPGAVRAAAERYARQFGA